MSRPIDEKIVKLALDYNTLKSGAVTALGFIDKLKNSITGLGKVNPTGAADGIDSLARATSTAERGMEILGDGIDGSARRFDALKTIATGALLSIGSSLAQQGMSLVKAFTIDPVIGGWKEYELKLGSVQTIMTNTGESVEVVNAKLDELNTYSDKTVYSFNDMTKAIGSLSTSGMKLNDSADAIMGFYNLAAGVGVEAGRAGVLLDTAMVQAIQLGKMDYQNWKQLQQSGMGGPKFKDALIANAQALGKNVDLSDGFNESLKQGWATTDVMLATLKQFKDDKSLLAAATQVLSFSKLMDTAKESVESGWAQTWEIVFGNFNESKAMWTGVWNAIEPIIEGTSNMRNNFILAFKEAKGFQAIIGIFGNVWKTISNVTGAIGNAIKATTGLGKAYGILPTLLAAPFRLLELITRKLSEMTLIPKIIEVAFRVLLAPLGLVSKLFVKIIDLSVAFFNGVVKAFNKLKDVIMTVPWKLLTEPFVLLKNTVKDVIFDPIVTGIKKVVSPMVALKDAVKSWSFEPVKNWFKSVADAIKGVKLEDFKLDLNAMSKPFQTFYANVKQLEIVKLAGTWFDSFRKQLSNFEVPSFKESMSGIAKAFEPLTKHINIEPIKKKFTELKESFKDFAENLTIDSVTHKLVSMYDSVGKHFESLDIPGKVSNIIIELQKFYSGLDFSPITDRLSASWKVIDSFFGGIWEWVKQLDITPYTDKLQNGVQKVIDKIGAMERVDVKNGINKGFRNIGEAAEWMGGKVSKAFDSMKPFFSKMGEWASAGVKMIIEGFKLMWEGLVDGFNGVKTVAGGLKGFFSSIGEFVQKWGKKIKETFGDAFSTENLVKGGIMVWLGLLLKGLANFQNKGNKIMDVVKDMFENFGNIPEVLDGVKDALGSFNKMVTPGNILKVAVAIGLLALSIKLLSTIEGKDIASTLGLVATAVVALVGVFAAMSKLTANPAKMAGATLAMSAISGAMVKMSIALKLLSTIDSADMGKSIAALVMSMTVMTVALIALGKTGPQVSVGLKGVMGLSVAILILAQAVKAFAGIPDKDLLKGGLSVAAALMAMSISMRAMSNVKMGIGTGLAVMAIAKSLIVMADATRAFGSMDLGSMVQGLIGVGIALAGMTAALVVLDKVNTVGSAISIAIVAAAMTLLIVPIAAFGNMDLSTLAKGLGTVTVALAAITIALSVLGANSAGSMIGAMSIVAIAAALNMLIIPITVFGTMDLKTLAVGLGAIAAALLIVVGVGYLATGASIGLVAIATAFGSIALAAVGIAVAVSAVIKVLDWLSTNTRDSFDRLMDNMIHFIDLIQENIPKFVSFAIEMIDGFAQVMEESAPRMALAGIKVLIGLLQGIRDNLYEVVTLVVEIIETFLQAIGDNAEKIITAVVELAVKLINGFATAIRDNAKPIVDAVANVFGAVLESLLEALAGILKAMVDWFPGASEKIDEGTKAARKVLEDQFAPEKTSKIGADGVKGFTSGIEGEQANAKGAADKAAGDTKDALGSKDAKKEGKDLGSSFTNGLGELLTDAKTKGGNVSKSALDGLDSKNAGGAGRDLGTDFTTGVQNKSSDANTAGRNLGTSAKNGTTVADASGSGRNFGQGFANGIVEKQGAVSRAAEGLANMASRALDWAAQIFSPSRITTKSGGFFGQGFANGITNETGNVEKSAADLALSGIDALGDASSDMSKALQDGLDRSLDLNPVIRPTLDMSEMNMDDMRRSYQMLTNVAGMGAKIPMPSSGGTGNTGGNHFTINLTTYGDLPLSTVRNWTGQIQSAIKEAEDNTRFGVGEEVVY